MAHVRLGGSRRLGDRYFGFNTPVMWDMPFEDPKTWPLFTALRPGLLRFPGGLIANHWDWKTGRVSVPDDFVGAFRAGASDAVRFHPQGSSYEDFAEVIAGWGAEANLVLNIETATVANQVEWVEHLLALGVRPTRIELGNEQYFAPFLGNVDRFPNFAVTAEISREYIDAIRSLIPEARFALQSSSSRFDSSAEHDGHPLADHLTAWDDAITDDDWYDALAIHKYPEIGGATSPDVPMFTLMGPVRRPLGRYLPGVAHMTSEEQARWALGCVLARVETGTRRQVEFLATKAPGKQLWASEWGIGENAAFYRGENPIVTGFWIHAVARQIMTFLSHSSVTQALNHSLYFDGRIWSAMRRVDGPEFYRAHGCYDVFRWFGEALDVADGDITVHETTVDGAERVRSPGPHDEHYTDVAAVVVDASSGKRSAIVHNASSHDVDLDVSGLASSAPTVAETIHTPSLLEGFSYATPQIQVRSAAASHQLGPNTVSRFVWRR